MTAQTPKNIVAGSATVPPIYEYQAFPKCVYGESLEDVVIIQTEEERPEGYLDYDAFMVKDDPEAAERAAAEKAAKAAEERAAAEAEYRASITTYLDAHDVAYDEGIDIVGLEELKVALDAHLASQGSGDDA